MLRLVLLPPGGVGKSARGPLSELLSLAFVRPEAVNKTHVWFVLLTASRGRGSDSPDFSSSNAVRA